MKIKQILLLALIVSSCSKSIKVTVTENADIARQNETIELSWSDIKSKIADASSENIIVTDSNGTEMVSQILTLGTENPVALIFQTDVTANGKAVYNISHGKRDSAKYISKVNGRLVPERKDDFTWENNRIAYRMYGPALEATGEISNGIDVWLKRTEDMIIDKWYTKGYDYHSDSGEGLDNYKVGRTLGAGAFAPISGDSVIFGNNFISSRILDNGPIRITFELDYAPFDVNGTVVTEKRTISLDANSNMNRVTELFTGDFNTIKAASGITTRNNPNEKTETSPYYMAYTEPEESKNGITYIAVITSDTSTVIRNKNHILKPTTITSNTPYSYYTGAYWSKSGVESAEKWSATINKSAKKYANPLEVVTE